MHILISLFCLTVISSTVYAAEENCQSAILENLDPADGSISAQRSGENEIQRLTADEVIAPGILLTTDSTTTADIRLCEGTVIRVAPSSQYRYESMDENQGVHSWLFSLLGGSVRAIVAPSQPAGIVKFRLQTPNASVGVRGTEFVVDHNSQGESQLYTLDGEVLMGSRSQIEDLKSANQAGLANKFQAVSPGMFSSLKAGQGRPEAAQPFDISHFRSRRIFQRELRLERRSFAARVKTSEERKKSSPIFQRTRSQLKEHLGNQRVWKSREREKKVRKKKIEQNR